MAVIGPITTHATQNRTVAGDRASGLVEDHRDVLGFPGTGEAFRPSEGRLRTTRRRALQEAEVGRRDASSQARADERNDLLRIVQGQRGVAVDRNLRGDVAGDEVARSSRAV